MTEPQQRRTRQRNDRDDEVQRDHPHAWVHFTRFGHADRRVRRSLSVFIIFLIGSVLAANSSAQTLTNGPTSGSTALLPSRDYATYAWQDAWDMDKRTDLGWMTWGVDLPSSQMVSKQLTGCSSGVTGCQTFQFTPTEAAQPLYFLLDTWQPSAAKLGKVGARKPIRTDTFKYLIIKMRIQNAVSPASFASLGPPQMVIYWSRDTIYYDGALRPTGGILRSVTGGNNPGVLLDSDGVEANQWQLYVIDLSTIQWWNQSKNPGGIVLEPSGNNWGQSGITADSFFVQPINWPGSTTGSMEIDWVQLSESPAPAGTQLIKWTGGNATYDVVISPSSNCVGQNANNPDYTVAAENVSRTSGLSFPFGSLPAGTYYVGLRVSGNDGPGVPRGSIALCSAGNYAVPGPSTFQFVTPTDEGSSDDFATVFLNNAWDFDSLADVDSMGQIANPLIDQSLPAQRPEGNLLGNIRAFRGTNTNNDPLIYPFWFNGRGKNFRIDPARYRIFSIDLGVDGDRDINAGSIGRIVWHVAGDKNGQGFYLENVTEDIVLRHLKASSNGGLFVLDHLRGDLLNTGSVRVDPAAPSRSGWTTSCFPPYCPGPAPTPGIDGFRIDFHEFPQPLGLYIKQAKLASLEHTGPSYVISWTTSIPNIGGASAVVKLYADRANVQSAAPHGTSRDPIDPSCNPSNPSLLLINGSGGTALALGANQSGQFTWQPSQTPGISTYNGTADGSGEYYICAVVQLTAGGQTLTVGNTITQFPVLADPGFVDRPRLYMDQDVLRFTAVYDQPTNSFVDTTPDQTVSIVQVGAGSPTWQLNLRHPDGSIPSYLKFSPGAGNGPGVFTIGFDPAGLHAPPLPNCTIPDGLASVLTLGTGGTTANDPQVLQVFVTIKPSPNTTCSGGGNPTTQPAFGVFDAPVNGATGLVGAVGVSGWALDDVGVASVQIWRNCVIAIDGACASATPGGPADKIFIGPGAFFPGARPDVEQAYPNYPFSYRAGWGLLMLTNQFPHLQKGTHTGGQGQFTLYVYAIDEEGHYTQIGAHTVTLDNDNATIPFGSIDTPSEGGSIPGTGPYSNPNSYPNFGWAMTQAGKCIDVNNINSYRVFIDGVQRPLVRDANWFPGLQRSDLSTAFPGLCNTNNALAAYTINASALGLGIGLHTIAWTVTDSAGKTAGIGSRFFYLTAQGGGASAAGLGPAAFSETIGRQLGRVGRLLDTATSTSDLVVTRLVDGRKETLHANKNGARTYVADPLELMQVELPKGDDASGGWEAYTLRGGRLWVLPLGASFDENTGTFSWGPVAGFVGTHDFLFVRQAANGEIERINFRVIFK